jgi:hypothetical protein
MNHRSTQIILLILAMRRRRRRRRRRRGGGGGASPTMLSRESVTTSQLARTDRRSPEPRLSILDGLFCYKNPNWTSNLPHS